MSEHKHTPGPWKPRKSSYRIEGVEDTWCIDWSPDQEEVAEIVHGEANAHLIAAAPDLLAACELALNGIELSNGVPYSEDVITELRAAIARAKGETP
jgi:hypothetical protein